MAYFTLGFGPALQGRTLGGGWFGIRVVDVAGDVPSYRRAAMRAIPFAILLGGPETLVLGPSPLAELSPIAGLGFWVFAALNWPAAAWLDSRQRSFADLISGTTCIQTLVAKPPAVTGDAPAWLKRAFIGAASLSLIVVLAVVASTATLLTSIEEQFSEDVGRMSENSGELAAWRAVLEEWHNTGVVDDANFVVGYFAHTAYGKFRVAETSLTVNAGSLQDQARVAELQSQVAQAMFAYPDLDLAVVRIVQTGSTGLLRTCREREFSIPGREEVARRASAARSGQSPCS